jgi:hypothetical protein
MAHLNLQRETSDWKVDIETPSVEQLSVCPPEFSSHDRTNLHVRVLVKAPPIKGPNTDEMPNTIPNMLWNIGRLARGIIGIMIIMAPEKMPALPKPAMARPKIKTGEVGAAPHIAEPTSKIITEVKKVLTSFVNGQG